jgi:hypothetical protein
MKVHPGATETPNRAWNTHPGAIETYPEALDSPSLNLWGLILTPLYKRSAIRTSVCGIPQKFSWKFSFQYPGNFAKFNKTFNGRTEVKIPAEFRTDGIPRTP